MYKNKLQLGQYHIRFFFPQQYVFRSEYIFKIYNFLHTNENYQLPHKSQLSNLLTYLDCTECSRITLGCSESNASYFFSLRTAIDTKHIITLFSREKLSATEHCFSMESPPLVVHFHYDKQKPACCTCKSLHGLRVSPLLSALLPASGPTWTWSCCCHWGRISREAI